MKQLSTYTTARDGDNALWMERVEILDDKTINYHFFRASPFCKDGYKDEVSEGLERRGWRCGMMGITYKEGISYEEILGCMLYKRAYQETYESLTKTKPLANIPVTVSQFLDLVDTKAEIKKKTSNFPPEITWNNLEWFLQNQGLTPLHETKK